LQFKQLGFLFKGYDDYYFVVVDSIFSLIYLIPPRAMKKQIKNSTHIYRWKPHPPLYIYIYVDYTVCCLIPPRAMGIFFRVWVSYTLLFDGGGMGKRKKKEKKRERILRCFRLVVV
jgi:hypothetical protein